MTKYIDIKTIHEKHKLGLLDEAESDSLKLLSKTPDNSELLHSLGIIYTQKKDFGKATKYLESALNQNPDNPSIALNLSNVLKIQGYLEKAKEILMETSAKHPNYPPAFNNLGIIYYLQKKLAPAINAYNKAIELFPEYVDAYYNLGLALYKNNELDNSIKIFNKLLLINPDHLAARFHLACVFMEQKDNNNAIKEFLTIELDQPFHFETQTNLASCFLNQGKLELSKKHYFKAHELNKDDTQVLLNLGIINMHQNNLNGAINYYQKAISENPNFFDAHNNVAVAFLANQQTAYALKHFKEAYRIKPQNKELEYTIQVLSENKNLPAAPAEYIKSLFDSYAKHYDSHLINTLEYKIPIIFEKSLGKILNTNKKLNILDVGCGTGLCSEPFKPIAKKLVGVDLSNKMLAVAAQKKIYDDLINKDTEKFLKETNNSFDLILAGDAFIYTGFLDNIFNLISSTLNTHGLFVFNTEINKESDFSINISGRFSHKRTYLDKLAEINNFAIISYEACFTRMQNNKPVIGHVYVLQKGLSC
ncbi:tetratricopeptide repeat protein [Gammaproteobacteria bacterium]|nr:tetratricopeptide repeat protein [Gammaproteobacteria bacterium]